MFDKLMINLKGTASKVGFAAKKNSPEILLIVGIVGVVASEIGIGVAATKVKPISIKANKKLSVIHQKVEDIEDGVLEVPEGFDERKEIVSVYAHSSLSYAKLFGPYVLTSFVSLALIIKSHNILKDRNVALVTAYTLLDKGFQEYRKRVSDRFGNEVEEEIRYNIKRQEIVTTDEDGNETTTIVEDRTNPEDMNFARFFAEGNIGHTKNADYNRQNLSASEQYWNQMLIVNGHVFLNEVYRSLGIEEVEEGQMWGWKSSKGNEPTTFVEFGFDDETNQLNRDFMAGKDTSAYLTFPGLSYILGDLYTTKKVISKKK